MNKIEYTPPNPVLIILRLWLDVILDSIEELPAGNREFATDKILITLSPYLLEEYCHKPKMPGFVEK